MGADSVSIAKYQRPDSRFTPDERLSIIEEIIEAVERGNLALPILKKHDITYATFWTWLDASGARMAWDRAKLSHAEVIGDQIAEASTKLNSENCKAFDSMFRAMVHRMENFNPAKYKRDKAVGVGALGPAADSEPETTLSVKARAQRLLDSRQRRDAASEPEIATVTPSAVPTPSPDE